MSDILDRDEGDRLARLQVHLETVQRIAGLGSWEADADTEELRWSPTVHQILDWPEDVEPSRLAFLEAVHPDDRPRLLQAHADVLAGQESYSLEHRIIRRDGTVRHVQQEAVAERKGGRVTRVLGTMQDVTDRMTLTRSLIDTESRRRELLHRLVRASEHERAQLAGDLHDGPIQMLTVAAMRLEHLGMVETDTPDWLPDAVETVRDTVVQLRDVLVELHPRAGAAAGLEATLTQLALTVVPDLDVTVEVRGDADDAQSRAIFGIVQEALWDVREQARIRHLDIDIDVRPDEVDLCLTGDPSAHGAHGLLGRAGLLGVRERTEGFGGRCTVEVVDGLPVVRCCIPRTPGSTVDAHG